MTPTERAREAVSVFKHAKYDHDAMAAIEQVMANAIRRAEADAWRRAIEAAAKVAEEKAAGRSLISPMHGIGWEQACRSIAAAIRALTPEVGEGKTP